MTNYSRILTIAILCFVFVSSAFADDSVSKVDTKTKASSLAPSRAALKSERDAAYKEFVEVMKTVPVDMRKVQMNQRRLRELDRMLALLD